MPDDQISGYDGHKNRPRVSAAAQLPVRVNRLDDFSPIG
jgi:hypothetical protein